MTDIQIFMKAPENASPEDLKAYLDEACGDDAALRVRVEALFEAEATAEGFMSGPVTLLDDESGSPVIDRYKLLQEIGEGGFGIVYMADQLEPVKRRVAIKVVKEGMATRPIIARFEAERQALAMMEHPNIARVLDAGTTQEKRPYFVMELIKGIPITTYCEQENLPVTDRLRLFMQVCQAVQHAHIKGIIHRDLKPSNVLVTVKDGEPVPKVIDFGIAKALDQRLTEKTLFTRFEQMIGTPSYMSPEQAALSGVDVDTRSDVYALGVLLYELLTGTTPFDLETLNRVAFDEMRRIIREVDPPKPSTRLSRALAAAGKDPPRTDDTTAAGDTTLAARRHRRMTETVALLRGDLDWIVMRCLEKDRNRRYETANGLLMDIQRHLGDEPVLARPPTPWYRIQKLAKRNKLVFYSATIVLLALLIGLGSALWGLSEANKQRHIAQTERDEARTARSAADEARARADAEATRQARQVYLMRLGVADKAILAREYPRAEVELDGCAETQRGWEWDLLYRRAVGSVRSPLPGAERPFFSRDGKRVLSLGRAGSPEAGSVIVREVSSGRTVDIFPCDKPLLSLALSPQNNWLAVGDIDGTLTLWNVKTHEKVWERAEAPRPGYDDMAGSNDGPRVGLAFSPDEQRIASANFTNTLKVFDTRTGEETLSVKLKSLIRKVMFSPDGRWLAAGSGGGFDPNSNLVREENRVTAARLFSDIELSVDGPSVLVDTQSRRIIEFPPGAKVPTFSPDGAQIATGDPASRTITLWHWDGSTITRQQSWRGASSSRFFDLCYMPDGEYLASAQGKHAMVWQCNNAKPMAHMSGYWCDWLAVSPDGNIIALGGAKTPSGDAKLVLWHWMGQRRRIQIGPLEAPSRLLDFSPDGQRIAMGSHSGQQAQSALESPGPVVIAEVASGNVISTISRPCRGFAWMPDGRQLVVTRDDEKTHELYDAATGEMVHSFPGKVAVGRPFVDDTGRTLTSVGRDAGETIVVRQWDFQSTQLSDTLILGTIEQPGAVRQAAGGFWNAAVGPRGEYVAVYGGFKVKRWDTLTKAVLPDLQEQGGAEDTMAFTEDGRTLYLSGGDRFGLYDTESAQAIHEFAGPTGAVAVSPDKKHVVSCGRGVVIWDIEHGLPIVTLSDADETNFIAVDWSPDHRHIAAAKDDGTVHIWTLPDIREVRGPQKLLSAAE